MQEKYENLRKKTAARPAARAKRAERPEPFRRRGSAAAGAGIAAVIAAAAILIAVAAPDHHDDDQNDDPPPAIAERADTRTVARHTMYLQEKFRSGHRSFHVMRGGGFGAAARFRTVRPA